MAERGKVFSLLLSMGAVSHVRRSNPKIKIVGMFILKLNCRQVNSIVNGSCNESTTNFYRSVVKMVSCAFLFKVF